MGMALREAFGMEDGLILIAESNPGQSSAWVRQLTNAGYQIRLANGVKDVQSVLKSEHPHLVLLDLDQSGDASLEVVESLRSDSQTPVPGILMRGIDANEGQRIAAFDRGVDDFIAREMSEQEFLARIKANIRRVRQRNNESKIQVGNLVLDAESYIVTLDGELLNFGPTEFRLLKFLMTHPNKVHSRSDLLTRVWKSDGTVGRRTVDVHVRRLRSALEHRGYDALIQTVTGVGYRFMADAIEDRHQSVTLNS